MKKIFLNLMIVSCGVITDGYLYSEKETNFNDIVFQNIEALAGDEYYEDILCYGKGSVDCNGIKVEMKIEGLRLD